MEVVLPETSQHARLLLPPTGRANAYALVLHESPEFGSLVEGLVAAGFGVLHLNVGALKSLAEVAALAEGLEPQHALPRLLVGHGLGGLAALLAAPLLPSVKAVATLGAPARVKGEGGGLVEALGAASLEEALGDDERAYLFLHAPGDAVVPLEHAAQLYELARHPKSFVTLDGADHALSREADARYAARLIAAWAERYLDLDELREAAYSGERSSVARTGAGLATRVSVRGFHLAGDEPKAVGGGETAPTPVDYLAVALSSCTSMTLRMYADRKGWPLKAVTVQARQRKPNEGETATRFERVVTLEGELSAEQRQRLLEIADRCPVHRTLEAGAEIESRLEEAGGGERE